ncbi:MAG TPA: pirin family protein [Thermoanaerobaculia bacterium]|jgi:hypothetical protein
MNRKVRTIRESPIVGGMNSQHRVRHVLEPGNWQEYDPFLMLAEDWFVPGTFGDHPHRGFETVTFILDGQVIHSDNHGGHGELHPGDAQWMTAGRGVVHSEEAGPDGAHSLQLWLNLPRALKMSEPRYRDLRGAAMPVREGNGATLRVFSDASTQNAPSVSPSPVTMVELRLDAGASATQELPSYDNAFVYVISGSGRFGADEKPARAGSAVWFERGSDATPSFVRVIADEPLHAILWSGKPIGEPVAARGPFVMTSNEELYQAFVDFQSGRF